MKRRARVVLCAVAAIALVALDGAALLRWPFVALHQRVVRSYAVVDVWPHGLLWPSADRGGPELCVFSLDWDAGRRNVVLLTHVQDAGTAMPASAYGHALTAVGAREMVRDLTCSVNGATERRPVVLRDLSAALFPADGGTRAVIEGRAFQIVLLCPVGAARVVREVELRGPSGPAASLRLERGDGAIWGVGAPPRAPRRARPAASSGTPRLSMCLNSPLRSVRPFRVFGSIKEHGPPSPPSRAMLKLLRTWVEYHLFLGVEHVHLYERYAQFEPFVEDLIARGVVSVTQWPPFLENVDQVLRDFDQVHINTHCVLSHVGGAVAGTASRAASDAARGTRRGAQEPNSTEQHAPSPQDWLIALDLDEFLRIAPSRSAPRDLRNWLAAIDPRVDLVLPRRVPFASASLRSAPGALIFEEQVQRPSIVEEQIEWEDARLPKWMVRPATALAAHNHAVYLKRWGDGCLRTAASEAREARRILRPPLAQAAIYHYGKLQDLAKHSSTRHGAAALELDDSLARLAASHVRARVVAALERAALEERPINDDGLRWRGRG